MMFILPLKVGFDLGCVGAAHRINRVAFGPQRPPGLKLRPPEAVGIVVDLGCRPIYRSEVQTGPRGGPLARSEQRRLFRFAVGDAQVLVGPARGHAAARGAVQKA